MTNPEIGNYQTKWAHFPDGLGLFLRCNRWIQIDWSWTLPINCRLTFTTSSPKPPCQANFQHHHHLPVLLPPHQTFKKKFQMNNFKLIKFINFRNHNIHLVCNIFHHVGIPKINMQCKQQTAINEMPFINYTLVENLIITRLQTLHAQFFFPPILR